MVPEKNNMYDLWYIKDKVGFNLILSVPRKHVYTVYIMKNVPSNI